MSCEILDFDLHRIDVLLRMPFRYGIATMTDGPVIFLRLRVVVDGHESAGISSDLLPPKWFTKIPGKPISEEVEEMLRVIRQAGRSAIGLRAGSAFDLWRQLYDAQSRWAKAGQIPPLLANFGVSLVERALIEAIARASGKSFAELLHQNSLGIRLDSIHPSLLNFTPADLLPPVPLQHVTVRHTVGLADPLTDEDIDSTARLDDGLPQSLTANIRRYGLHHFKIKVNGDLHLDMDRLSRIAAIIQQEAPKNYAFSLDGNEQFKSLEQFRGFWNAIQADAKLREFFKYLLFVEQPLHRDEALRPELETAFADWPGRPTMIIDESDATLEDLPLALQLGYAGTSHKNCKGIFKGVANRCLLLARQRAEPTQTLLMSGEDLCNIGPVALLQDLAVMAALGIESVERNGHHYHPGLSHFPKPVREQVLQNHPDLYQRSPAGWPTLRIDDGRLALGSINGGPFGVGFRLDVESFARVD